MPFVLFISFQYIHFQIITKLIMDGALNQWPFGEAALVPLHYTEH